MDKRRHPRLECDGIADVQQLQGAFHSPARILDLSLEGCLFVLEEPLDLVTGMIVEITFTVNQLPFRVRAEVRALRSHSNVGFSFPVVSPRTHAQLADLIAELQVASARRQSNLRVTAAPPVIKEA